MSDYLDWQSNLSLETIFKASEAIAYPHRWNKGIVYLSSLVEEQGRSVLVYRTESGSKVLTPKPFSLKTRINEYGGKPFWFIDDDTVIFVNDEDQCLYQQKLTESLSTRISPKPNSEYRFQYADLCWVNGMILAVVEQAFSDHHKENYCFVGLLDPSQPDKQPMVFEQGADFYAKLSYCAEQNAVAWMQWSHPMMPWDQNQLRVLELGDLNFQQTNQSQSKAIDLGEGASVSEVLFAESGQLYVVADFPKQSEQYRNYWNIYAVEFDESLDSYKIHTVTRELAEFGYPHWQYGDQRLVELDQNQLLAIACYQDHDKLWLINQKDYSAEQIDSENQYFQNLSADKNANALALMRSKNKPLSVIDVQSNTHKINTVYSTTVELDDENISEAEHFSYQTSQGEIAYGYYYPAVNQKYQNSGPPPLLVMVHGGPTARAYGFFDLQKQFWTQSGFAIFDVNHRGSIGYGRDYRDRIYPEWGLVDAQDVVTGVKQLIAEGKANENAICIRGKSAGGYAVQRALTEFPEVFCAGASYYGIGNFATLAETTHKFEKHYTDRLLGEAYNASSAKQTDSQYYQRSPVNFLSQLKSSMIIFQGLQDKVVPPSVAQELVAALEQQALDYQYVEYADEAHGFRQAENNIDAWQRELDFYRKVIASNKNRKNTAS